MHEEIIYESALSKISTTINLQHMHEEKKEKASMETGKTTPSSPEKNLKKSTTHASRKKTKSHLGNGKNYAVFARKKPKQIYNTCIKKQKQKSHLGTDKP